MKLHCALGTIGITLGNTYRDLCVDRLDKFRPHLFVAANQGTAQVTKSWYMLTRRGWVLLRREDQFGEYRCALNGVPERRRPPLMEWPEEGIPQRAWELRDVLKPYQLIDWYGKQLEVISFPCPERDRVTIMLREPGDPTTLKEETLVQFLPEHGPVGAL